MGTILGYINRSIHLNRSVHRNVFDPLQSFDSSQSIRSIAFDRSNRSIHRNPSQSIDPPQLICSTAIDRYIAVDSIHRIRSIHCNITDHVERGQTMQFLREMPRRQKEMSPFNPNWKNMLQLPQMSRKRDILFSWTDNFQEGHFLCSRTLQGTKYPRTLQGIMCNERSQYLLKCTSSKKETNNGNMHWEW
jgi:hypothetical protein